MEDQAGDQFFVDFEELKIHRKASIYYDPVKNPYGAPPSGQVLMYRHPDGSVKREPPELPSGVSSAQLTQGLVPGHGDMVLPHQRPMQEEEVTSGKGQCSLDSTLLCSNVEHAALARLVPSTFALQLAALDLGKETLKVKQDEGGGSRPNFSSRRRLEIDFGTCLNNDMSNEHQDVTTILAYPCWDVQAEMGRLAVQLVDIHMNVLKNMTHAELVTFASRQESYGYR
ncbi:unnamed protein product [Cladocopium goreaui]|uniref:Copia protein n=1 Tax=Cladocopium goreaui TaxID=2562237 RepID=A0A9P1C564_9DINO|nr:unnamed protein product [Cladocopium goreaui]